MPSEFVDRTARLAEETAVDAVWQQWSSLTATVVRTGRRSPWSIVDPEALVLASLGLTRVERRLGDLVASWAAAAGFLMSKPRLKSLGHLFPEGESRIAEFARYAAEDGSTRWNELAAAARDDEPTHREKPAGPLRLLEGPSLILRFRAGFGVNAKADVLAVLLGQGGQAASLKLITTATGYTERMIRTATREMALAGFIQEIEGRPSSFYVDPEPWAHLLQIHRPDQPVREPSIPPWRFWAAVFSFLMDVAHWGEQARRDRWTDYVASSKARDVYAKHERRLKHAGLMLPSTEGAREPEYGDAFYEIVEQVREWTLEAV